MFRSTLHQVDSTPNNAPQHNSRISVVDFSRRHSAPRGLSARAVGVCPALGFAVSESLKSALDRGDVRDTMDSPNGDFGMATGELPGEFSRSRDRKHAMGQQRPPRSDPRSAGIQEDGLSELPRPTGGFGGVTRPWEFDYQPSSTRLTPVTQPPARDWQRDQSSSAAAFPTGSADLFQRHEGTLVVPPHTMPTPTSHQLFANNPAVDDQAVFGSSLNPTYHHPSSLSRPSLQPRSHHDLHPVDPVSHVVCHSSLHESTINNSLSPSVPPKNRLYFACMHPNLCILEPDGSVG